MNILILTRNVLAEKDFQDKLLRLNQEVYCTGVALDQMLLMGDTSLTEFFPVIILSETLLNEEVTQVSSLLKGSKRILLRGTSNVDKKMDHAELKACGIDGQIKVDSSVTMLREELAVYQMFQPYFKKNELVSTDSPSFSSYIDTKFFMNFLSKKERIVFQMLYEKRGKCVLREEFYAKVWSEDQANSKVVHLSALIRKIRAKLNESSLVDYEIITEHGHGYKLA